MKEKNNQAPQKITEINVQRLTGSQLEAIGHKNDIPEGEVCIVALERNRNGDVLQARVMEGVDDQEFLFGDEEYFDWILGQAKELLNSKK